MTSHTASPDLKLLFQPRSIAIIGASRDPTKSGGMFISRLLSDGYAGRIYPINPKEPEIMSIKSYPSILDVPDEIDLTIIAISNNNVPRAMAECSQKKCRFAIVHSAGFGELGPQGKTLENEMLKAARSGGVRVIGPNCMGLFSPQSGINTVVPYSKLPMEHGTVAFVGQSGWTTENFILLGIERGLRFSGAVSIGNQSDLTIEDLLEYFGNDNPSPGHIELFHLFFPITYSNFLSPIVIITSGGSCGDLTKLHPIINMLVSNINMIPTITFFIVIPSFHSTFGLLLFCSSIHLLQLQQLKQLLV